MTMPNWAENARRARVGNVKTAIGILALMGALAAFIAAGCATWHSDWEKACGPQIDPQLKPCSCFDSRTLSCPPPPRDAKKPKNDGGI